MAKKVINYNSIMAECIHKPRTKSGYPLYTKSENYTGGLEGNITQAEKDSDYLKLSPNNFSSPTNIRKIAICGNHVYVVTYGKPVAGGNTKNSINLYGHYHSSKTSEDLFNISEKILDYYTYKEEYEIRKSAGSKVEPPTDYEVRGSVLGLLSNPYTCNNIEEVYIDWTMFLSEDVKPYFPEIFGNAQDKWNQTSLLHSAFMNNRKGFMEIRSDSLMQYFFSANNITAKNFRNRFPRLKILAMISNLQEIYGQSELYKNVEALKSTSLRPESTKTTYDILKENNVLNEIRSICMVCRFPTESSINTTFNIKNQYKYDSLVLDNIAKMYKSVLSNHNTQSSVNNTKQENKSSTSENQVMGELEKRFIEIENKYSRAGLNNVIKAFSTSLSKKELKLLFSEFTTENRDRMAALAGIKLTEN